MANIDKELQEIKNARFGEEVRDSFCNGLHKMNEQIDNSEKSAGTSASIATEKASQAKASEEAAKASETNAKASEAKSLQYMNATQKMSIAIVGDITFQVSEDGVLQAVYDDGL